MSKVEGSTRKAGTPNKATASIREAAQAYGQEALDTLVALIRTGETGQIKAAAAPELLDRGFGNQQPSSPAGTTPR
jgi:hypothetical protein